MGNNATLAIRRPDGTETDLLGATYLVPLYWLACLSPSDALQKRQEDPDDPDDYILFLSVSSQTALARFAQRADAVAALIEHLPTGCPAGASSKDWAAFLASHDGELIFDLTQILEMDETTEASLKPALSYFVEPSQESADAVLSLTCLSDLYEQAAHRQPDPDYLMGYAW